MMNRLIKKIKFTAEIELLSGLHIGATNTAMGIGGLDSYVVRNPIDNQPYIPGSSLKGKMRSLLELSLGECDATGNPSTTPQSRCGHLFGTAAKGDNDTQPSRIIVRDALMLTPPEELTDTDLYLSESKTEVAINRINGSTTLRTIERVPKGVRFGFEAILNIFADDDEQELETLLHQAIRLLQDDYLGGSGSRGYGHIRFNNLQRQTRSVEDYIRAES